MGRSGGLALMWNDESLVEIQNFSWRNINAVVRREENGPYWKFTSFYGNPEARTIKNLGVYFGILIHCLLRIGFVWVILMR